MTRLCLTLRGEPDSAICTLGPYTRRYSVAVSVLKASPPNLQHMLQMLIYDL